MQNQDTFFLFPKVDETSLFSTRYKEGFKLRKDASKRNKTWIKKMLLKSFLIFPKIQNPLWMEITSIFLNLGIKKEAESL